MATESVGLKCPACLVPRDERFHQCLACERYWVIPDADKRRIPPVHLRFRLPQVWHATLRCAAGFERADHIEHPCALSVEEFEKFRLVGITREQRMLVDACLSGLQSIYRFSLTQNVADLYDGWLELIPAASEIQGLPLPHGWDANVYPRRSGRIEFRYTSDSCDLSEDD